MRKMFKAMLLATSLFLYTGCTGGNEKQSSSSGNVASDQSVTVWAWDKNFNIPVMEKAAAYYQKDGHEDFSIEVVEMANEDVMQRLISGLSSGVSEGLPDIVLIEDYDAQNLLTNYEGTFADLTNELPFEDFAKYKVKAVSHNGKTYGVPFDSGTAGLYYRTDYLEEAGYTADDMQNLTWSKFVEIGKDVKEKTGKWFVAFIPNRGTHYIQLAMQSAGLWYFDENGDPYFKENPAIREMAEILKEIDQAQLAKPVDYFAPEGIGAVTG